MRKAFFFFAAALAIVGCSGSRDVPEQAAVTLPPGTSMHVVADVEVGQIVTSRERAPDARRMPFDGTPAPLVSATPQVILGVPDPYVSSPPVFFELNAAAYIDVPVGETVPSSSPPVRWTQSGAGYPATSAPGFDPAQSVPPGLSSFYNGEQPKIFGETIVTATIPGAGFASIEVFSFHALGLVCTPNGLPGDGTYTQGVTFDASGTAVQNATGIISDLALTGPECTTLIISPPGQTLVSTPYGSTTPFGSTSSNTAFLGINAATFVNQGTSFPTSSLSTIFGTSTIASPAKDKFVFKTHDGRLVKFLAIDAPPDTASSGSAITGLYGFYSVSDANGNFTI